jgi:hypothetical protein
VSLELFLTVSGLELGLLAAVLAYVISIERRLTRLETADELRRERTAHNYR